MGSDKIYKIFYRGMHEGLYEGKIGDWHFKSSVSGLTHFPLSGYFILRKEQMIVYIGVWE
jgi:hypothetical protein